MNNYCMIQNSKTFAFSAENPTGVRAGGSQGGDCTKLRPTVTIPAGETVTLVDAAGPGVIQHMWFTGSSDNLKPELVLESLFGYMNIPYNANAIQIHRLDVYAKEGDKFVSLLDMGEEIA